jgi:transcriptional regulator with XRE-family HTH domain
VDSPQSASLPLDDTRMPGVPTPPVQARPGPVVWWHYARLVPPDPKDRWRDLGSFIREQRGTARLSLRRLSELAGISNPYLSQIERGLRRPSAEILQQIAKALRISAETLYVQAGILDAPDGTPDLTRLILADQSISEEQKQALVRIYLSFRREYEEEHGVAVPDAAPADDPPASDPPHHAASA